MILMTTRRKTKHKGPVRSKKVTYDGITFASGLEKYMYKALKEACPEMENRLALHHSSIDRDQREEIESQV